MSHINIVNGFLQQRYAPPYAFVSTLDEKIQEKLNVLFSIYDRVMKWMDANFDAINENPSSILRMFELTAEYEQMRVIVEEFTNAEIDDLYFKENVVNCISFVLEFIRLCKNVNDPDFAINQELFDLFCQYRKRRQGIIRNMTNQNMTARQFISSRTALCARDAEFIRAHSH